jgi:hypothetical protein
MVLAQNRQQYLSRVKAPDRIRRFERRRRRLFIIPPGGQVPAMFDNPLNALPHVKAGASRALAVTGSARLALIPDEPTVAEEGYPGLNPTPGTACSRPPASRDIADKISRDPSPRSTRQTCNKNSAARAST